MQVIRADANSCTAKIVYALTLVTSFIFIAKLTIDVHWFLDM